MRCQFFHKLSDKKSAQPAAPRSSRRCAPWRSGSGTDDGNALSDDLKRLVAGDRVAWEGFVQRYARVIFAAVQRRLVPAGRAHEVDDVTQDVFVKICSRDFKLLRSFDPARAKLSTFLTVIATSSAIDHLRRQNMLTTDIDAVPQEASRSSPRWSSGSRFRPNCCHRVRPWSWSCSTARSSSRRKPPR